MTHDVAAALTRVPSPVVRRPLAPGWAHCGTCAYAWRLDGAERHSPDCWWPAFVEARESLAAGVTVEGVVGPDGLFLDVGLGSLQEGTRVIVTIRPVEAKP
jgi:hypothetical protein